MKLFTFLFLCLFFQSSLFAAPPTVPASNLVFGQLDGTQFSGSFTAGNGAYRIVVMKAGSPVTGIPVNGVEYNFNSSFGSAASAFTSPGEFVVARTTSATFNVTNLTGATVYYVAVFEYNGSTVNTQYLTLSLTGSQSTVVAPTTQVSALASTAKTGNTVTLNWINGNGSGRIVVARKGAPVDIGPSDFTNYFPNENFGNGTKIGTDKYVVFRNTGTTTSTTVRSLEPNTVYYFAIFEYNGISFPAHLKPGAEFSTTTNAGPGTAPSSPGFNYIEGNSFYLAVAAGNGNRRLFIGKKESPVTAVPVSGQTYVANAAFGTAASEIAPGEFVLSASSSNSVKVTNLEPNTTYHFRVYEYDADAAGNNYYLTSSYAVKSGSTCITPSQAPSNIQTVSVTGSGAVIKYTSGNGAYRLVMMKAGSAVNAVPVNLVKYTGNGTFGSGQHIARGNYCMFSGINGSQFTVTNLVPGTTYHVSIYDFNGSDNPVYSETAGTFSFTAPLEPTVVAKDPWKTNIEGASLRVLYIVGNGTKRLVVARKGSAVTAMPADFSIYTASENFGQGHELAPGQFVVASNEDNYVDVKNLEIGTTYHLAVFEYNVNSEGKPDYLTSSWLATSAATVATPTAQSSVTGASNVTSSSATLNLINGNGQYRFIVMKQGSEVNITPQNLIRYSTNTVFGSAAALISDGNYGIYLQGSGNTISVSGLQPNTTYHAKAFDFNGYNEPVFLTPAAAGYSFTTPDMPGATTPTSASVNPVTQDADGNKLTLKWTSGNGQKRIVVMKKGSNVSFVPNAGTDYVANAAFSNGIDIGNGEYIVYNGAGNTVDLTNLSPSSVYYYTIYEFNGAGALIRYLVSARLEATAATVSAPATPAGSLQHAPASKSIRLNWVNGSGAGCLVVMKENGPLSALPVNLSVYPSNPVFKSGSQIAASEYVVYAGTGNTVNVTGLTEGTSYYFAVFEYNGTVAPVYNTSTFASGSAITLGVLPVKLIYFNAAQEDNYITLNWATSSEVNNSSFIIERSIDGIQFVSVTTVAGAGSSNNNKVYTYNDYAAQGRKVYYRLKQVDTDGDFTYSAVQIVNTVSVNETAGVYPNPVQNRFRISLPEQMKEAVLSVYDMQGRQQFRQKIVNGQFIETGTLIKGSYCLIAQSGEKVFTWKIVKQ